MTGLTTQSPNFDFYGKQSCPGSLFRLGFTICCLLILVPALSAQKLNCTFRDITDTPKVSSVLISGDIHYILTTSEIRVTRFHESSGWELLDTVPRYPSGGYGWLRGQYLIDYGWPYLTLFDLTDPIHPIQIKKHYMTGVPYLEGNTLYEISVSKGLTIYDLNALPSFSIIGRDPSLENWNRQTVSDGYIYQVMMNKTLRITDCTIPHSPHVVKEIELPEGIYWDGMIKVLNNRLFITEITENSNGQQTSEWKCYQIGEDWELNEIWSYDTQGQVITVMCFDNGWLLGFSDHRRIIRVVDIHKFVPRLISQESDYLPPTKFVVQRDFKFPYIYLIDSTNIVRILKMSDEGVISQVADYGDTAFSIFNPSFVTNGHIIAVRKTWSEDDKPYTGLYHTMPDGTLEHFMDIPDSGPQSILGDILYGWVLDSNRNHIFAIFRLHDDSAPELLSTRPDIFSDRFMVSGNLGFTSALGQDFVIYDLSEPENPQEIGRWNPKGILIDSLKVLVDGNILFVCDYRRVWILDISDPSHPQQISMITGIFNPEDCLLYDSHYFIVADDVTINIYDVSDLSNPTLVMQCFIPADIYFDSPYTAVNRLAVTDHYLISSWWMPGVWIFDLDRIGEDQVRLPIGQVPAGVVYYDMLAIGHQLYMIDNNHVVHAEFNVIQPGDLNEDGRIDSTDLMLMSDFISENSMVQPDPDLLDLNKDGDVNLLDLIALAQIISGA